MTDILVVANGYNTSYIDSLLIALFYRTSHLKSLLTQYPEKSKFIYLQELINSNFLKNIRSGYCVDVSIINEIRNYSIICGWKENENITKLHNVVDYMKFLMQGLGFGQIDFEFVEFDQTENQTENEKVKILSMNYIDVPIFENTNTKLLLDSWCEININKSELDGHQNKHQNN